MKCFNCNNDKATCYYSPKELYKYQIYFCSKCLHLIKNEDLRYIQNQDEIKRLIKRKDKQNGRDI